MSKMNLFQASNQWSTRPDDERFETLESLQGACAEYKASAIEKTVPREVLRVEAHNGDLALTGKAGVPAQLTHWAFGQLARTVSAPAEYLRQLPATLAAQNLNHGLAKLPADDTQTQVLFHRNGNFVVRAMTSERYTRVWNADIVGMLREHLPAGWRTPPARPARAGQAGTRVATEADVISAGKLGSLAIKVGDVIAPAGLYASDHDLFVFQVNEDRTVDDGSGHGLNRGFFLWNSEVGASSFGIMTFLYDAVCGNHIVWGASNVLETRIRHVGHADAKAFGQIQVDLTRYADESSGDTERRIKVMRSMILGATKEAAIEGLIKLLGRKVSIPQKLLADSYDAAETAGRYGNPGSVWGMVNGLTEVSQRTPHADERVRIDRLAGRVAELVF